MTEQELIQARHDQWRLDGRGACTLEEARSFLESVGMCVLYPPAPPVLAPTFLGAYAGTDEGLPAPRQAFQDLRAREATELMVRLLREKAAFEANVFGEAGFLVSAAVFPYLYGVAGDKNPRQTPAPGAHSGYSPLARDVFEAIRSHGATSKPRLQEMLGGSLSTAALDRALNELWSRLRITRVDYTREEGAKWDALYRWAPERVQRGLHMSQPEALSALVSKYLEAVVAAEPSQVEEFFGRLVPRSRVKEAINALLAARELSFVTVGKKSMVQVAPRRETFVARPRRRETAQAMSENAKKLVIAIDGPAGAGKSTIAARLARKLGYVNLESGAMYRALALKAIRNDVSFDDEGGLLALARNSRITLEPRGDGNRVLLDGFDVSERIRQPDVTEAASRVSVHPAVRAWMVERQREMGQRGGVIMEGRDIGTVVFPNADVKIFLEATPEVRVERRMRQRGPEAGRAATVATELQRRDQRDRTRAASPLVPAPDAVVLDSTHLSIDEVVRRAEELVRAKLRNVSA